MNRPSAHQRADGETFTAEQTPAPPQPVEDRGPLGVVMAVELNTGDLYRRADSAQRARDRARHGSDLWIVTILARRVLLGPIYGRVLAPPDCVLGLFGERVLAPPPSYRP